MDSLTTGIVVVVTVVVMVVAMAAAARRLLGANFGLVRLFLAGAVALLVAGPISRQLAPHTVLGNDSVVPLWFLLLAIACALLVAMVLLVVAAVLGLRVLIAIFRADRPP